MSATSKVNNNSSRVIGLNWRAAIIWQWCRKRRWGFCIGGPSCIGIRLCIRWYSTMLPSTVQCSRYGPVQVDILLCRHLYQVVCAWGPQSDHAQCRIHTRQGCWYPSTRCRQSQRRGMGGGRWSAHETRAAGVGKGWYFIMKYTFNFWSLISSKQIITILIG